jgi:hypothetical protein
MNRIQTYLRLKVLGGASTSARCPDRRSCRRWPEGYPDSGTQLSGDARHRVADTICSLEILRKLRNYSDFGNAGWDSRLLFLGPRQCSNVADFQLSRPSSRQHGTQPENLSADFERNFG